MSVDFLSNLVIEKIICANRVTGKTKRKKYNRSYGGIVLRTSGESVIECDGKTIVCDAENVLVLPKGVEHICESSEGERLLIDFHYKDCPGSIFSVNIKDISKLLLLFNKIENNRIENDSYSELKNFRYLYEMLVILAENAGKRYKSSKKLGMIKPAVDYILSNYGDAHISLETLSEVAGMGKANFRKTFSEVFGCPPMTYVNGVRMNKATDMLKGDYATVEEIAHKVGYNSVYHFSKMFKKNFGMSPTEYRKKL